MCGVMHAICFALCAVTECLTPGRTEDTHF